MCRLLIFVPAHEPQKLFTSCGHQPDSQAAVCLFCGEEVTEAEMQSESVNAGVKKGVASDGALPQKFA